MEFQLVLVRHGYSLGNEKSLFSGWSDVPLTERGRRELRELRQVIRYPIMAPLKILKYLTLISRMIHSLPGL